MNDLPPHHNGENKIQQPNSGQSSPIWCRGLIESFSGVRGVYGEGITESLAYKYAFCFVQLFCKASDVLVIAGDSRPSTDSLKKAMLRGFEDAGIKKIFDLGLAPVQIAEYGILTLKANGGVYITASHNEPEFNGWKFLKSDGAILYLEQADKLISLVHSPEEIKAIERREVLEVINKHQEAIDDYIEYVLEKIGQESIEKIKKSNFCLLVDPNGGSSVEILEKLFNKLNVKAEIINKEAGKFNRLIEPKEDSLKPLAVELEKNNFDFACGFDCDADRMEIVLSPSSDFSKKMGAPNVSGNYVLALACDAILQGTSGQVVPTNDVTSYLVRDIIKKYDASVFEVEVGEINVVEAMKKNNCSIGGEGSCAGVIVAPIGCRDGIITVALALKLMASQQKTLSDILIDYPAYFSDRTKVACSPEKAVAIREKIENYFKEKGWSIKKTGDETGGLKAHLDKNSFVWFRQSKTEPGVFRIYSECDQSKEKATKLLEEGIEAFNKMSV
ncbi:MAG: hypothetical protein PHY72_02510 [Candidatus Pacebacteria bacterium]|nr:hypothetical protein [Candidatus Paceibacterota bacterium]